jgi:hypothetical protein
LKSIVSIDNNNNLDKFSIEMIKANQHNQAKYSKEQNTNKISYLGVQELHTPHASSLYIFIYGNFLFIL